MAGQDAADGTPFGRYRLVELLGRGGVGEVWRAFDTATERVVAFKVLPARFADDEMFQQRFRREARSVAGLNREGNSVRQLTASAMAVTLVLLSIGVAHADSNDDDFVQQVNNIGIIGPPGNLINNAHTVCQFLNQGGTRDSAANNVASMPGFTPDGAANFVSLSVTHYCPGH